MKQTVVRFLYLWPLQFASTLAIRATANPGHVARKTLQHKIPLGTEQQQMDRFHGAGATLRTPALTATE